MAYKTPLSLRNQVIYQIFVRQYSEEGSFAAVERDLPRIRDLGVDIIYFAPIQPIGQLGRKGSLGSPYSIRDYRALDPSCGSREDFIHLTDAIRSLGMKSMLDIVYNHTSRDSLLSLEHPDWFYKKPDGSFGNRIGDWTDVIDLDYSRPELWDYQIETLKNWASIVDGFRCDVAPIVPLDFWLRARRKVAAVRPDCIWLAESVEPAFIRHCRSRQIPTHTDTELYEAFDLTYDYDITDDFYAALDRRTPLSAYAQAINRQEVTYPANYSKIRFLENHDRARAAFLIPDPAALVNWTAFSYFQKGTAFLYAGQEFSDSRHPSLFEKEAMNRTGRDLSPLLSRLSRIKKDPIFTDSSYRVEALPGDFLVAEHRANRAGDQAADDRDRMIGIFSCRGDSGLVDVSRVLDSPIADGCYENLIDHTGIQVYEGHLSSDGSPMIFRV